MCFSATASFLAGGALSAAGVVTLRQAKQKRQIPFASIPLLFGIQQLIEGAVWVSFGSTFVNGIAVYAYLLFAHVFWPVFTPLAVLAIEKDPIRQKLLRSFVVIGFAVAVYLVYFILSEPMSAHIVNGCIAYKIPRFYPLVALALYFIATCGSCLASSHKIVVVFGAVLILAFAAAAWFYLQAFFSVWCFFSAILSILVYWNFRSSSSSRFRELTR